MNQWKVYRKRGVTEMRPYVPGEDLTDVYVVPDYEPKAGDMIARDPVHILDQWLLRSDFFESNYEQAMVLGPCYGPRATR